MVPNYSCLLESLDSLKNQKVPKPSSLPAKRITVFGCGLFRRFSDAASVEKDENVGMK